MSPGDLICQSDQRRDVLREANAELPDQDRFNGIDYVDGLPPSIASQEPAFAVHFLCGIPAGIGRENLTLTDVRTRKTLSVDTPRAVGGALLVVARQALPGNLYRLDIGGVPNIDPRHASAEFLLKLGEVALVDPKPRAPCPPPRPAEPNIDYLARDFGTLRQVILDRLAQIMPDWRERHVPDLGMTLVELMAYMGDHFSYYQDAVATEAYLGTARSRISVRRHARLVDYQLHEGCNARAFLQFQVAGSPILDAENVFFITKPANKELAGRPIIGEFELEFEPPRSYECFEIVSLPNQCPVIELSDVKSWVGFIGHLIDDCIRGESSPGHLVFRHLPADLQHELERYAEDADTDPPEQLVLQLREALNRIIRQCCLWEEDQRGITETNLRLAQMIAEFGRHDDPSPCNRVFLEDVFCKYFSVTNSDDKRRLYEAHNRIEFYTWDQTECCLPIGATSATLRDRLLDCGDPADSICCDHLRLHQRNRTLQNLSRGDFLILEEVIGPKTGNPADADPTHRQVVRLTDVKFAFDPVPDPYTGKPRPIVHIEWNQKDALRFPLCISSISAAPQCGLVNNSSIARGNVLLIDHGLTTAEPEPIGTVPHQGPATRACCDDFCATSAGDCVPSARPSAWSASLDNPELTFAQPIESCLAAADILDQKVHQALPQVVLFGIPSVAPGQSRQAEQPMFTIDDLLDPNRIGAVGSAASSLRARWIRNVVSPQSAAYLDSQQATRLAMSSEPPSLSDRPASPDCSRRQKMSLAADLHRAVKWEAKPHLTHSEKDDQHFVVEIDSQRRSRIRFGDDDLGRRPDPGTEFSARYRTGNGPVGNVGADKIRHVVFRDRAISGILQVRNPLPAGGGTPPESLDHAKLHAPQAFREPRRAIIAKDYRDLVMREFAREVQQVRATLHWTGSQTAVKITVDPVAAVSNPNGLLDRISKFLHRYRRIGHCVQVEPPIYVPLDIEMTICVVSGYLRAHVQQELLEQFSDGLLPDGTKGFFHPDNLTFGDSIFVSRLVWTAKRVPGVENVTVDKLRRMNGGGQGELAAGVLKLGPLEIPLLENDGSRPNCGQLCLNMWGAR